MNRVDKGINNSTRQCHCEVQTRQKHLQKISTKITSHSETRFSNHASTFAWLAKNVVCSSTNVRPFTCDVSFFLSKIGIFRNALFKSRLLIILILKIVDMSENFKKFSSVTYWNSEKYHFFSFTKKYSERFLIINAKPAMELDG